MSNRAIENNKTKSAQIFNISFKFNYVAYFSFFSFRKNFFLMYSIHEILINQTK